MKLQISIASVLLLSAIATQAPADQVVNDDLIVQGRFCDGFDCVNDQVFGTETIRLRQNNTRLTFIDVTADPDAQSWRLVANDSVGGGLDWFQLQVRPDLSGSSGTDDGTPVAHFGVPGDGSVALGRESEIVAGAVSIGQATLERRIMHVARALADTDLATVADIESYTATLDENLNSVGASAAVESYANTVNAQLDAIDTQLDGIERAIRVAETSKLVQSGGSGSASPFILLGLLGCFTLLRRLRRQPDSGGLQ